MKELEYLKQILDHRRENLMLRIEIAELRRHNPHDEQARIRELDAVITIVKSLT